MPDPLPTEIRAAHRAGSRGNGRAAARPPRAANIPSRIRWASIFPTGLVVVFGTGAVAWVLSRTTPPFNRPTIVVLGVAGLLAVVALVTAAVQAQRVATEWDRAREERENGYRQRIEGARSAVLQLHGTAQWLLDQVVHGARPPVPGPLPPGPADIGDPFVLFQEAAARAQHAMQLAVATAASTPGTTGPVDQVDVFVNLSHRLQGLVVRTIQVLDDMYRQLEDPDLLGGLYQIDHLVTRMRRHAENLAVLGGAVARRQWTTPQAISEVLRSATAEVEQFGRVKLVPPMKGTLAGHAVADVVHLVAELIENATNFSAPETPVMVRVDSVAAGVVIEIDDRGLGMQREDLERVNGLLADPHATDLVALLRDGRLGHYVVSRLAGRHDIRVQLQRNIYGGTQAAVVIPSELLGHAFQPPEVAPPQAAPVPARQAEPAPPAPPAQPPQPPQPAQPAPALAMAHPAALERGGGPPTLVPTYVLPSQVNPGGPVAIGSVAGGPATPGHAESGSAVAGRAIAGQVVAGQVVMRPMESPAAAGPGPVFDDAGQPAPANPDGRPELPRRVSQTHIAPPLRQTSSSMSSAEPAAGHDPRLMADYRRGFAEAGDGPEPQAPGTPTPSDRVS